MRTTSSSPRVESPAAKRPTARRGDRTLCDQVRALRFEVEDLQHALMCGLVDDLIGHTHEHLVEEAGHAQRTKDSLTAFAREVTNASLGEEALVSTSKTRGLDHVLGDDPHVLRAVHAKTR